MEYYGIKKSELLMHVTTWVNLKNMDWKKAETKVYILPDSNYIKFMNM